jgi:hypothetical protein
MIDPGIIAAIVALVASLIAAYISISGQRSLKLLEAELEQKQESAEFLAEKLTQFYLPVMVHLSATKTLYDRFFEAGEDEKKAIKHELRLHNTEIRERLMDFSIYLESDAPEDKVDQMVEHLIQWEIVYKLKYEYKVYDGPVFAGVEAFGFRGFPPGGVIDEYFGRKVKDLRERYHKRLEEGSQVRDRAPGTTSSSRST